MTVSGSGLIFQPVLASLHYTQTCICNNDTIIALEKKKEITDFYQSKKKKRTNEKINKRRQYKRMSQTWH